MLKKANSIIKPRGSLIFCYDAKQLQHLSSLLNEFRFNIENIRFVHGTEDKPASVVMIRAKKSSNALTKIEPPLIHFENGSLTKEAKEIYQKTRTYSIKCKI
jgi:tRNA1(Val) A37 N6-methylase TrmN6